MDDLAIISPYKSRVRAMTLSSIAWQDVGSVDLLPFTPPTILFPRLSQMSIHANHPETKFLLRNMPHTVSLVSWIDYTASSLNALYTLAALQGRVDGMRSLTMIREHSQDDQDLIHDSLCTIIRQNSKSESLTLSIGIRERIVYGAAALPFLRELVLDRVSSKISITTDVTFSHLASFCVGTDDDMAMTTIFARCSFPELQSLTCRFRHQGDQERLLAITTAIAASCSSTTLTSLNFIFHADYNDRGSEGRIQASTLLPLLILTRLRRMYIAMACAWVLDDAFIDMAGAAWPDMEVLYLDPNRHWPQPSGVTLAGLEQLTRHCPHLKSFGAVFNTDVILDIPNLAPRNCPQSKLVKLSVGPSKIRPARTWDVVIGLVFLVPLLQRINTFDSVETYQDEDTRTEEHRERWRRVLEGMAQLFYAFGPPQVDQGQGSAAVGVDP